MAFKKFINPRKGSVASYDEPYLSFTKHHMVINDAAKKQIGKAFKFVVLYFDDETSSVGLRFWKERALDSYSIGGENERYKRSSIINGMRFFEKFGIREIVQKVGKDSFPLVRDEKNKDFYTAALKK